MHLFRTTALLLGFLAVASLSQATIPAIEREALIALYQSTGGASWTHRDNWRNVDDTDFNDVGTECTWSGVFCDSGENTVVWLVMTQNNLVGTIPPELGNLVHLDELLLDDNQLTGPIPPELGTLGGLRALWLGQNHLTGPIPPELGNLSSLEDLVLFINDLTGPIPPELGNLSNLETLQLRHNHLTGTIPPQLGNLSLSSYLTIDLEENQLTGTIPPELGNLTNLHSLRLSSNRLTGSIPAELGTLPNLEDNQSDFRWNGLHTTDASLATFLAQKQYQGDWESTQTLWPENPVAGDATACSVTLSWDAVTYLDPGGYRVEVAEFDTGPWNDVGVYVPSKTTTSVTVTGLNPNTTYWFRLRSYTLPHRDGQNNQNTVLSDPGAPFSATTSDSGGGIDGDVDGDTDTDGDDHSALLDYLFVPAPAQRPDVDCDGAVNATDVMAMIGLLW